MARRSHAAAARALSAEQLAKELLAAMQAQPSLCSRKRQHSDDPEALVAATEILKRMGLLHELVPKATTIAVLINPNYQPAESQLRDVQEAAARLNVQLVVLRANTESDFEDAFRSLTQRRGGALLVAASPFFNSRRERLVVLAARHAVPAIYEWREFAEAGGLMSYGTNLADAYRQAGIYVGKILRGATPADLPVVRATKFEFVLNLKTAKVLGLAVPQSLLIQAKEVIE